MHHKHCKYRVLIFNMIFVLSAGYAQESLKQIPAGTISNLSGTLLSIDQDKKAHKLLKGDTFYFSTSLITSKDSIADLSFHNGSFWTMSPSTKIKIIARSEEIDQLARKKTYFKIKLGMGGLLIRSTTLRNSSDVFHIATATGSVTILPHQPEPAILIYHPTIGLIFSGIGELNTNTFTAKIKKPLSVQLTTGHIIYYEEKIQPSLLKNGNYDQLKNYLIERTAIVISMPKNSTNNKHD